MCCVRDDETRPLEIAEREREREREQRYDDDDEHI